MRRDDLLAWLGQRLGLTWTVAEPTPAPSAVDAVPRPVGGASAGATSPAEMAPLLELVRLGYYKGIVNWLDDWVGQRPEQADFAQGLRTLAREFRFEAIEQRLLQPHSDQPILSGAP